MKSERQREIRYFIYSVFIALLFLSLRGYKFNIEDQAEHLPQVYRLIDPGLYPGDFFVSAAMEGITIRTAYVYLIFLLSYIAPVSLICFVLTVFCLALTCYAWMKITALLDTNPVSAYISPLLIFFLLYHTTAGGNHLQSNMLLCTSLAEVFASFAIYGFMKGRYNLSALLLGAATLFQLLVGFQLFLILGLILLGTSLKDNYRAPVLFLLLYLSSSAFIFFPIFYKQFFLSYGNFDRELYYELLFSFRNRLHYLPSLFPVVDYIKLAAVSFPALFVIFRYVPSGFLKKFYLLAGLGLLVYTLSLEILGIYAAGKIQWFKITVWIAAFNGVILAVPVGRILYKQIKTGLAERGIILISGTGALLMLFAITNSSLLPFRKMQGRYMTGNYKRSDLTLLHEWIEKNTSRGSVILTPPEDSGFLCEAKRPTPVAFKPIIHEPSFLLPWYERFSEIYGISAEDAKGRNALQLASELYNIRKYQGEKFNISYRIDNIKTCKFTTDLKEVIHREGDYILTEY